MAKIIVFVICLLFTTFSNTIPQEARAGGFSVRKAGGFSVRQKGLKKFFFYFNEQNGLFFHEIMSQ